MIHRQKIMPSERRRLTQLSFCQWHDLVAQSWTIHCALCRVLNVYVRDGSS